MPDTTRNERPLRPAHSEQWSWERSECGSECSCSDCAKLFDSNEEDVGAYWMSWPKVCYILILSLLVYFMIPSPTP